MRNVYEPFVQIRKSVKAGARSINNFTQLGASANTRGVHIVWMYPDTLSLFGARGDVMALMHFSTLMKIPCTIHRCNTLSEEVPMEWADFLFFPSGDLACMQDICEALKRQRTALDRFVAAGKLLVALGSTGAILAKTIYDRDGASFDGLGLLNMVMTKRECPFGDDLCFTTKEGIEVLCNQIQMLDVKLGQEQAAFGQVVYGRGNCGEGTEGARSGHIIFSHMLGPALVRNPRLTEWVLKECVRVANGNPEEYSLSDDMIEMELAARDCVHVFLQKKKECTPRSGGR